MLEKKKRRSFDFIDAYFEDFERWVERMDEMFTQKPCWNLRNCTMEPLREINMTATEVIVTADLPLTEESTVQVRPIDNSLEISAKMRRKLRLHELGISQYQGEIEKFRCHVHIPVPVNMDKMGIKYKKGILEVHLPRKR